MSAAGESNTEDEDSPAGPLLIAILAWTLLLALVLMAFFSAVGALNRDLYSPSGFVRTYLQMLSAHDVNGALSLAGASTDVPVAGSPSAALLDARALGELRGIAIERDDDLGAGRHRVTATYTLVSPIQTVSGRTEFTVRATLPTLGLLAAWRFDVSPLARLAAVVQNAPTFTIGGVSLAADPAGASESNEGYVVLVPGIYTLAHSSHYLRATPAAVPVTSVGQVAHGYLDAQANRAFLDAVQTSVDVALQHCAEQQRLFPTGCPFGKSIDDRIVGSPSWSVQELPPIRVIPGYGGWYVPQAQGVMRLDVAIRSLYDGTVSAQSFDVEYTISPRMTVAGDGTITITW